MEEVVGSIPTRSTVSPLHTAGAASVPFRPTRLGSRLLHSHFRMTIEPGAVFTVKVVVLVKVPLLEVIKNPVMLWDV